MTTPTNGAGHGLPEQWPDYVMLRDTKLHDDMGGLGQRIYTTAGAGYKKVKYVREDLALSRGVPDGLKRYDHEVVGTYSHWEVRAHESPNGEWVRYADAWLAMFASAPAAAGAQGDGGHCHCATCTCRPGMTKAIRYDTSPAEHESAIRQHLIDSGWTPPQPAAADGGIMKLPRFGLKSSGQLGTSAIVSRVDGDYLLRQDVIRLLALSSHRQAGDGQDG